MKNSIEKASIAISLKNVNKSFNYNSTHGTLKGWLFNIFKKNESQKLQVLNNVSLEIKKGEIVGIIGRNGCGKTTLTKIMAGVYAIDKGSLTTNGTLMLMNLGVGMSHELTAKQNIYVNGSALGLRINEIDNIFEEIIEFAELEKFINTKIKFFSTGMIQRLSFSIAVNAGAEIIFLDEVFAVGDAVFRKKAIKVFENNWLNGRTVIMVSHSLTNIEKYCDKTIYLKNGYVEFYGDTKTAINMYNKDNENS